MFSNISTEAISEELLLWEGGLTPQQQNHYDEAVLGFSHIRAIKIIK